MKFMPPRSYCTLFDSHYLPRGLVLAESLAKHAPGAHLYVFSFDDVATGLLRGLDLKNVTVIPLQDLETPDLLAVKPSRSRAEYCWTCTPAVLWYCLDRLKLPDCTYVDADMEFYSDPEVMIQEAGSKDVIITSHRYSPQNRYLEALSGKYCVQFMFFRNNENGRKVLGWWRDRCLEWCYARHEDGKFGDQKYLDDWPARFPGIHESKHLGGGIAPWNADQYRFQSEDGRIWVTHEDSNEKVPLIFYHFHAMKIYENGTVSLGDYRFSNEIVSTLYRPYLQRLFLVEKKTGLAPRAKPPGFVWNFLRNTKRRVLNGFRVYRVDPASET